MGDEARQLQEVVVLGAAEGGGPYGRQVRQSKPPPGEGLRLVALDSEGMSYRRLAGSPPRVVNYAHALKGLQAPLLRWSR